MMGFRMWSIFASVALFSINIALTGSVNIRHHTEVDIVDYNGPLHHEIFAIIRGVEILKIIDSNITEMRGGMLSKLTKLKRIVFINCTIDLDGVDLDKMMEGATNLKEFIAKNITARDLRPDVIRKLPIEIYVMTDNHYPTIRANMFNETKLRILDLARNHIEEIEDGAFNGLHLLKKLDLSKNKLKTFPHFHLKSLDSIEHIDMKENQITEFSAKNLDGLETLTELDLKGNPLKKVDLEGIDKVAPKLKTIDLTGSSLTEEEKNDLKAKHGTILKI